MVGSSLMHFRVITITFSSTYYYNEIIPVEACYKATETTPFILHPQKAAGEFKSTIWVWNTDFQVITS